MAASHREICNVEIDYGNRRKPGFSAFSTTAQEIPSTEQKATAAKPWHRSALVFEGADCCKSLPFRYTKWQRLARCFF